MGDVTRQIVANATAKPSDIAMDIMRLSMVDWMACGLAGATEPAPQKLRALIESEGGAPQAHLFGAGRAPARAAALVNGTASHALDYDDTHFAHIGHVSVGILPAALAVGELEGTTIGGLTRAALAGCEGAIRMGQQLGRAHYQIGFHQTATAGTFGATLAAGLLLGPDDTVLHHALGLASTRASGLKSQFGTDGKPYNAGIAAANGVESALLAARGFVSDPDGWDGVRGYVATHHGDGGPVADGFLMPEVSHKFHACCHGLHAALEAFAPLPKIDPTHISKIEVVTAPRWMSVCNKPAPRTGLEVKFSYRAVLALAALGYDTAALSTYTDALAQNPQVMALRDRVVVSDDPTLGETAAIVRVTAGGETHQMRHELTAPMPLDARQIRLRAKAVALIGADKTQAIWDVVHGDQDAPAAQLATLMAQ